MNKHVKIVATPMPTLGEIILAETDAEAIGHDLSIARLAATSPVYVDMPQYLERIKAAQKRLPELARRLGFDLVPAHD